MTDICVTNEHTKRKPNPINTCNKYYEWTSPPILTSFLRKCGVSRTTGLIWNFKQKPKGCLRCCHSQRNNSRAQNNVKLPHPHLSPWCLFKCPRPALARAVTAGSRPATGRSARWKGAAPDTPRPPSTHPAPFRRDPRGLARPAHPVSPSRWRHRPCAAGTAPRSQVPGLRSRSASQPILRLCFRRQNVSDRTRRGGPEGPRDLGPRLGPRPGPVPARRPSDAGAPRAPMRGGSQGLGVGGGPGECGLHTGQVGTAAPPAALEGPAAVGRTRNGWGRGSRGFLEVGRISPPALLHLRPPLPVLFFPPCPPSSLRGAVTAALVLERLLPAWCWAGFRKLQGEEGPPPCLEAPVVWVDSGAELWAFSF